MLSMLIEGEEVNQRAQTMGDQNQEIEKNLQTNQMQSVGVVEKKVTLGHIVHRESRMTNQRTMMIR